MIHLRTKLSAAAEPAGTKFQKNFSYDHTKATLDFLTSNIFAFVVAVKFCLLFSSINHKIHHFGRHTLTHTRRRLLNFMKAG